MDHASHRRAAWAVVLLASTVVACAVFIGRAHAQAAQPRVSQATCDAFAHSNLLEELDCLRGGHGQCRRTDLSGLFAGCSYEDEARLRGQVGLVDGRPLPTEAALELEYARAHPARYPLAAFNEGREGTGVLTVDVGADGRARGVSVTRSTEHGDLDRSAMEWARTLHFIPARADGIPVVGRVRVPVRFVVGGRTHVAGSGIDIPAEPPGVPSLPQVP